MSARTYFDRCDFADYFASLSIEEQQKVLDHVTHTMGNDDAKKIEKAISQGREAVLGLLTEKKVDPSASENRLICWASQHGDVEIVQALLKDDRVNPGVLFNSPLRDAIQACHHDVVRLLLNHPLVNPNGTHANLWACDQGHNDVKLLVSNPNYVPDKYTLFWASEHNHSDIIEIILSNQKFIPRECNVHSAQTMAAKLGHSKIVEMLSKVNDAKVVQEAISQGKEAVLALLSEKNVDPSASENLLICWASKQGYASIVQILLDDERVNPGARFNTPLRDALSFSHHTVVRLLLKHPKVDPSFSPASSWACKCGLDDVKLLLSNPNYSPDWPLFEWVCKQNQSDLAAQILANPKFTFLTYAFCDLINQIADLGHNETMPLLLTCPKFEVNNSDIISWACKKGIKEVMLLFANPNFVPTSQLLFWACKENHPDILGLILSHSKFSPNPNYSDQMSDIDLALQTAAQSGNSQIVHMLCNDDRINPQANECMAFQLAAFNGHAECVRILLPKVDPTVKDNVAIIHAANAEVARVLLADQRVDPTAKSSFAFIIASAKGRNDLVQVLLEDGRADPTTDLCACLCYAHTNGHSSVVATLMQDERVNPYRHDTYEAWFSDPRRLLNSGPVSEHLHIG